ncbi:MAG TPA: hypothetical protein VHU22_06815 [Xanthobacteraceae bacterium]|nr:hypothetical protein [Xanthobacteraceae bacterium]
MRKLTKAAALVAIAAILCGFNDANFISDLNAHRGEPVRDAIARLGPPIQRGHNGRWSLYYWHTTYEGRYFLCKIWGSAQGGIITNWGYQDCAF